MRAERCDDYPQIAPKIGDGGNALVANLFFGLALGGQTARGPGRSYLVLWVICGVFSLGSSLTSMAYSFFIIQGLLEEPDDNGACVCSSPRAKKTSLVKRCLRARVCVCGRFLVCACVRGDACGRTNNTYTTYNNDTHITHTRTRARTHTYTDACVCACVCVCTTGMLCDRHHVFVPAALMVPVGVLLPVFFILTTLWVGRLGGSVRVACATFQWKHTCTHTYIYARTHAHACHTPIKNPKPRSCCSV